jgi:dTDP-4-dehydrorhamnose 3,5-epimerase
MKIQETALPGVLLLTPKIYHDTRGAFQETWNQRAMTEAGLPTDWVQDNFSISKKNVLRGIHYQVNKPQGKLVRVAYGAVLDVAVDLRRSSSTYGKHVAVELCADLGNMLWVPEGFRPRLSRPDRVCGLCLQGDGLLLTRRRAHHSVERP